MMISHGPGRALRFAGMPRKAAVVALLCVPLAAAGCSSSSSSSAPAGGASSTSAAGSPSAAASSSATGSGPVNVLYAGSLVDLMQKQVGPAFAALRTGIDNSNAEAAAKNVAVLKQAFAETEAFWKTKAKTDATQWAADARKQVDLVDHAVAAAKWDDAKAPAGTLGQSCASCHGAYRERLDDGTYRIKMAGK